jgi:mannosyltransferase OCH1-like enzyme
LDEKITVNNNSWISLHSSEWQYKLWTIDKIKDFFQNISQDSFFSDVWMNLQSTEKKIQSLIFLILYHQGGVYVDIRSKCVKNLESLFNDKYQNYDFMIGQYRNLDKYFAAIINVKLIVDCFFVASIPNHIFVKYFLEEFRKKIIQSTSISVTRILSDLIRIYLKPLKLAIIPCKYIQSYHNRNDQTYILYEMENNDNHLQGFLNATGNNNNTLIIILITVFVVFTMILALLLVLSIVIAKLKSKSKTIIQKKKAENEKEINT